MDYFNKYLKYKNKYLNYKLKGGYRSCPENSFFDYNTQKCYCDYFIDLKLNKCLSFDESEKTGKMTLEKNYLLNKNLLDNTYYSDITKLQNSLDYLKYQYNLRKSQTQTPQAQWTNQQKPVEEWWKQQQQQAPQTQQTSQQTPPQTQWTSQPQSKEEFKHQQNKKCPDNSIYNEKTDNCECNSTLAYYPCECNSTLAYYPGKMNVYEYNDNIKFECININIFNNLIKQKKDLYLILIYEKDNNKFIFYFKGTFIRIAEEKYKYTFKCLNSDELHKLKRYPIYFSIDDLITNKPESIVKIIYMIKKIEQEVSLKIPVKNIPEDKIPYDLNGQKIPFFVFNMLSF